MAFLDVVDLLADPDLAGDTILIQRATRTVSAQGTTQDAVTTITTYGNVQPSSGQQINQLPEEQRVGAFITVYVPVPLQPLSLTGAPDIVIWENQQYRVIQANPFDNYGQGFYVGVCQLIAMAPATAVTPIGF